MIRAVLLGFVAATGATIVSAAYAAAITVFAPTIIATLTHTPRQPWDGPPSLVIDAGLNLAAEIGFGTLGGFVAGSLHRRSPLLAGVLLAFAMSALAVVLSLTLGSHARYDRIYDVIDDISGFVAPILGSLFARGGKTTVAA
jgi:hypothetical protein